MYGDLCAFAELLFLFSASWGSVFRLFAAFGFSHEVGARSRHDVGDLCTILKSVQDEGIT